MTALGRMGVALTLTLTPMLVLTGCQKGPAEDLVLFRVGQRAVSLAEFQRAFDEAVARPDGIKADSASARKYLQDYVHKTLLEQIATDSLQWTPLLEHRAVSFMESMMVRAMQRDVYGRVADVPEPELRKVYEKGHTAYRFRELPCPSREDALQKLATVRQGAAFALMVGQAGSPGDAGAGWRTVLDTAEGIIDILAGLGPEQVGGPVEFDGRYWLVQLLEKADNPSLPPFEEVKHSLKLNLARERGGRLVRAFHDEMMKKYDYQPRMAMVIWMTEFLREQTRNVPRTYTPPAPGGPTEMGMPMSSEKPVWASNPLTPEESAQILSTTTVDTVTAVLFLDHLNSKPSFSWPKFEKADDVMRLLDELVLSRLEYREAWARGYDKDPDIAWAAQKNRNLILTRQFIRQHIMRRVTPTLEEARAWYEAHPSPGAAPGRRRYILIDLATADLAQRAGRILAEVRDPSAAYERIRAIDPSANWLGPSGFPVDENATTGEIDREVFTLPQGGVTRPHAVGARFAVARVEEILVPSRPRREFETVKDQVVSQLTEARIDSVLNQYLAERRSATPVQIDEKVFRQIRYTATPPAEPGSPAKK